MIATCSVLIISCGGGSGSVNTTEPDIPVVIDPEPEPENITLDPALFVFKDSGSIKFYDGFALYTWKTGTGCYADFRRLTYNDTLYTMDDHGKVVDSELIQPQHNFCVVEPDGDVWLAYNVPPDVAYAAGCLYKTYTKIYYNNTEYGDWMTRDYETTDFYLSGADLISVNTTGSLHHINGSKANLNSAFENGFTVYDFNATTRTAKIDGVDVSWSLNFFNAARVWIKADGVSYSTNGYTWNGATLTESTSALAVWRSAPDALTGYHESGVVIFAGVRREASQQVIYLIECNSGYLFRYVPTTNNMTRITRLYNGDGTRTNGNHYKTILKPIVTAEFMFFCFDDGGIYRYNFDTGLIGYLCNGADWIKKWEAM